MKFFAEIARRCARAGPTGRSSRPPGPNSPLRHASGRDSCGEAIPCFVLQRLLRPNGQIRYLGPELAHVITYKAYDLIVSVVLCAYRSRGAIARAIATATQHLAATRYNLPAHTIHKIENAQTDVTSQTTHRIREFRAFARTLACFLDLVSFDIVSSRKTDSTDADKLKHSRLIHKTLC